MTIDINNPEHPHHELWRECITSLYETNAPITIEYKNNNEWVKATPNSNYMPEVNWYRCMKYRKASPKRVMITRTITYPAPMTTPPKKGSNYWVVDECSIESYVWLEDKYEMNWIKARNCYDNKLDAEKAYKALQCS